MQTFQRLKSILGSRRNVFHVCFSVIVLQTIITENLNNKQPCWKETKSATETSRTFATLFADINFRKVQRYGCNSQGSYPFRALVYPLRLHFSFSVLSLKWAMVLAVPRDGLFDAVTAAQICPTDLDLIWLILSPRYDI